jgi:hypothetical protein
MADHIEIPREIYAKMKEDLLDAWRAVQELAREEHRCRSSALVRASSAVGRAVFHLTMAEIVVDCPQALRQEKELERIIKERREVLRGLAG